MPQLHFGVFVFHPESGELWKSGHRMRLRPQAVRVLGLLVTRSGQVLSREELRAQIWDRETFVDFEHGLNLCIQQIREVLGDDATAPRYVETLPRRGYRFVAEVRDPPVRPAPNSAPPIMTAATAPPRLRRLLVPALVLGLAIGTLAGYLVSHHPAAPLLKKLTFMQLTDQPGQERYPSLSPDGNSFVYAGRASGNWDIYLRRVGGKNEINLTRDSPADDTQPSFSPDGERIAFRSEREGGGIFVMGATGESVKRLTDFGYNPAWSPDGKEIVCATAGFQSPDIRFSTESRLFAINTATGEKRLIAAQADAVQPQWSPHGHRIAYWGLVQGRRNILTVPARGGQPVAVTNDDFITWNPAWSPDGRYLYFSSNRGGSMNLWRVPIAERSGQVLGALEAVTTPSLYSGQISFSRDGRRIAYAQQTRTSSVYRIGFDPVEEKTIGAPVAITKLTREIACCDVSPDGRWLAAREVGKRENLLLLRTDGSDMRQLTDDSYKKRGYRWSPDGKRLAFFSNRSGPFEIWTVNADGSGLRQLTYVGRSVVFAVWAPDGARFAYTISDKGAFIMDVNKPWKEQSPEPLPDCNEPDSTFSPWDWSPDGGTLAGDISRKDGTTGIGIYAFASRKFERLTEFGSYPVWMGDSRRVIFSSNGKTYLIDRFSKKAREILSFPDHQVGAAVAPGGRLIYFNLTATESDIWLASFE